MQDKASQNNCNYLKQNHICVKNREDPGFQNGEISLNEQRTIYIFSNISVEILTFCNREPERFTIVYLQK